MYRLKSESGRFIDDIPILQYIDFNRSNLYPYAVENDGIGILVNNRMIYLLSDPESIKKQKELGIYSKYSHCQLEEVSSDLSISEMHNEIEETKKEITGVKNDIGILHGKFEDQNEQNLIIMAAIADLYETISIMQEAK